MTVGKFSQKDLFALAVISVFIFLFISPVISGDGFGYYAILEGIGKDHSLNLENQQRFNEASNMPVVNLNQNTGRFVSQYAPGVALFSLPLYSFSLLLTSSSTFHLADEFFLTEQSALLINQLGLTITALAFVFIALLFSLKATDKFYPQSSWLALLLAFFGTPMLFYASADPAYSHIFEAGLMALLMYFILVKKDARLQGISLGLLTVTRYSCGIFALPLIAFHFFKHKRKDAALFTLSFAPFVIFLMLYFQIQFGSPFSSGYASAFDSFLPVHFLQIIFDLNRGILLWTPLLLASIAGLCLFPKEEKWLLLSFFGLNFWVYSAWASWHSAWGFGNRFFVLLFPLVVLGLARLLSTKPKLKIPLVLGAVYTFILFMLFISASGILADPFNLLSLLGHWLASGNATAFLPGLIEKISVVRAILLF